MKSANSSQKILITGAASGMGRLLALAYADRGASVVAIDRDDPGLKRLCAEAPGDAVRPYVCDLTDPVQIRTVSRQILDDLSHIDVLINNAGIVAGAPVLDLEDDEIVRTFAVNTLAPIRLIRAFMPAMIAQGDGHLVTLASAGGFLGTPRLSDYCASKFALIGFEEALRLEIWRAGWPIRTTLIAPYFMDTGMFHGVRSRFPFLLPIMKPSFVASRILRAIDRGRKRVILPRIIYVVFPLRLLPVSWTDRLLKFFGITSVMDNFTGRTAEKVTGQGAGREVRQ